MLTGLRALDIESFLDNVHSSGQASTDVWVGSKLIPRDLRHIPDRFVLMASRPRLREQGYMSILFADDVELSTRPG